MKPSHYDQKALEKLGKTAQTAKAGLELETLEFPQKIDLTTEPPS